MYLNPRDKALLHRCLEHSLTHIEEIEDVTDLLLEADLKNLKARMKAEMQPGHWVSRADFLAANQGSAVRELIERLTLELEKRGETMVREADGTHECTLADLVWSEKPCGSLGDSVSFPVTCRFCGKQYEQVYRATDGLWDPELKEFVSLAIGKGIV